ncbi:hypothetical protein AVEN_215405-1 [Araneus ventricosus]|uniref:Uncharacterized protein n=1 Tax=Araneus ventricosus TaxID=182803 RepID=A0A4Y2GPI7_ARAVE|nr:hypothetical protein AVEN_215405-1 [Araneus ventricosus]
MTLCSKYPPSIIYTPFSALKSRVHGLKALYKEDFVPFRITAASNRAPNDWTTPANPCFVVSNDKSSGGLARLPACPMASGPLKHKLIWAPRICVCEREMSTCYLRSNYLPNLVALKQAIHRSSKIEFWGHRKRKPIVKVENLSNLEQMIRNGGIQNNLKSKTHSADSNLEPRCEASGKTKDLPTLAPRD